MVEDTTAYSQYHGIIQGLQRTAKAQGLELILEKDVIKKYAYWKSLGRIVRENYLHALEEESDPKYTDEADSIRDSLNTSSAYLSYAVEGTTRGKVVVIFDDQVEPNESMLTVSYEPPGERNILEETAGFDIFPDGRIETEFAIIKQVSYTKAFEYLLMLATQ
ncbi:MAG: hypothetical protein AABX51_02020 [Nanoarchaeota archaeon]